MIERAAPWAPPEPPFPRETFSILRALPRPITWAEVKIGYRGIQRRRRLARAVAKGLLDLGSKVSVTIVGTTALAGLHHARLTRKPGGIEVALNYLRLGHERVFRAFARRLPPLVAIFDAVRQVRSAVIDVSDGEETGAGIIGYCSRDRGAILVPDEEFCESRGYAKVRPPILNPAGWSDRSPELVWRGGSTGHGIVATGGMRADDLRLIPRTRLCLMLRDVPGTDVKFSKVLQSPDPERDEALFKAAGIFAKGADAAQWATRKFAIDIDGNTNAWSSAFTRLILGCCVLKVASPLGYRQWYYAAMRPWEHFVPVAADMSDLVARIDWCRAHDSECRDIGLRAQKFAAERTYEREMRAAADRIVHALGPEEPDLFAELR